MDELELRVRLRPIGTTRPQFPDDEGGDRVVAYWLDVSTPTTVLATLGGVGHGEVAGEVAAAVRRLLELELAGPNG